MTKKPRNQELELREPTNQGFRETEFRDLGSQSSVNQSRFIEAELEKSRIHSSNNQES